MSGLDGLGWPSDESDTPETDAIADDGETAWGAKTAQFMMLARKFERELALMKKILADPAAVHQNLLRGTIAYTKDALRHVIGDTELMTSKAQIAELERKLNQATDRIRDMLKADDGQAFKEARKWLDANFPEDNE